ncbi:ABC transporter permease subunit [[Ruminococcus] torques]|nr:ABC transporter permease subunit [[Ruminococcus] torques]
MIRLKETDFAAAAKIDGISGIRILFRHLLPNALGMIVVNFLFLIPQAIFTEAFLSFLGVGLSAPTASLGTLIQEGRDRMILYPCELLAPLITLCVLLVVFHILAMAMERRGGQTD